MMDVCLPGTGGMLPLVHRYLTCCWIEVMGKAVLIDCGEGTQMALSASKCRVNRMEALLITHFHADHISGLPGLMLTLGNQGKTTPLLIAGPEGIGRVVSSLLVIARQLPFEIVIKELSRKEGETFEAGGMQISSLPLHHKVPCLGYSAEYRRKPIFNPQKAASLGIPVTFYKNLHAGENVEFDGKIYTPDMVLDGARKPIKVTYCTDTRPFDEMADFARGSDLFVCEGMYFDSEMREKMDEKHHMLFADAAEIAVKAAVPELWLTHYSPALTHPEEYKSKAKEMFGGIVISYDGIKKTIVPVD